MYGDQLSVERAVNAIHSVSNGHTAEDRLEGLTMQLGDWHTGVKILEVKNVCLKTCKNIIIKNVLLQKREHW